MWYPYMAYTCACVYGGDLYIHMHCTNAHKEKYTPTSKSL